MVASLMLLPAAVFAQTGTSTTVRMPEDGGPLPRANMPEGGVNGKADGPDITDELPRANMPEGGANLHCHLHEHHGVEHSHCHDHDDSESHDHEHASDQHCHEHEHDGTVHEHCHGHEGGRVHEHEHDEEEDEVVGEPEEDCHEHDGDTHCHDSDSKTHVHPEAMQTAPVPQDKESRFGHNAEIGGTSVNLQWNGYLRAVAELIENDARSPFIGRNDGFKLANARLGLRAEVGKFYTYISFDAAVGERERFNDPNQEFGVRLRDAFMHYELSRFADISAGRFKTPYDLGNLESSRTRTFIDAPLESRGVLPSTGNEVEGLGQDRELGVMVSRDRIGFDPDGFDVGYALALTNGRTLGLALNDNDRPALFGRLSAFYGDLVMLNVGGFTDARTVGELPDLFDEDVSGLEVSTIIEFMDMVIEAQLLYQSTSFDSDRPTLNAIGLHAQWAYTIWDITIAYRFAWLDPNTTDLDDADARTEHTIGLSYAVEDLPLRLLLNGTVAGEQQGRQVDNNRLALMAQFIF